MGCSSQGGWAGGWVCDAGGLKGLLGAVGTGCWLGNRPCQKHQWRLGQSMHDLHLSGQVARTNGSTRARGLGSYVSPQKNRARSAPCLGLIATQRVSASTRNGFGFLCRPRRVPLFLRNIRPYSARAFRQSCPHFITCPIPTGSPLRLL